MFLLIIQKVIDPLFFDHHQIRNAICMMRHAVVIKLFQDGTRKIDAFTAVGQILAHCTIPDFAASALFIQTATGTEFKFGIFVLIIF